MFSPTGQGTPRHHSSGKSQHPWGGRPEKAGRFLTTTTLKVFQDRRRSRILLLSWRPRTVSSSTFPTTAVSWSKRARRRLMDGWWKGTTWCTASLLRHPRRRTSGSTASSACRKKISDLMRVALLWGASLVATVMISLLTVVHPDLPSAWTPSTKCWLPGRSVYHWRRRRSSRRSNLFIFSLSSFTSSLTSASKSGHN